MYVRQISIIEWIILACDAQTMKECLQAVKSLPISLKINQPVLIGVPYTSDFCAHLQEMVLNLLHTFT